MNRERRHIIIDKEPERQDYITPSSGSRPKEIKRDRKQHGNMLLGQYERALNNDAQQRAVFATIKEKDGVYFEFIGKEECDLVYKSLENAKQGIELLNVRSDIHTNSGNVQAATVFVPHGKEGYFQKKIQEYVEKETKNGNPKNKPLAESIETIQLAVITSFWTGAKKDIPEETAVWCEYWLRTEVAKEKEEAQKFYSLCDKLEIEHKDKVIEFPEKAIVIAKTSKEDIQRLIDSSGSIAEIRRAPELASFFSRMSRFEAEDWIEDFKNRIQNRKPVSYICILDTGINNSHPLLKDVIEDEHRQAVNPEWNLADQDGHGTEMAGICEYFHLMALMEDNAPINISHHLESVKILPSNGTENEPELYGAITADAVSLTEIENPGVNRVFCMAVTSDKYNTEGGVPSSWSGEVDNIAVGAVDGIKKLFVISAGNVKPEEVESTSYFDANINHSVENPGQAWNALTIGAYTDRVDISEKDLNGWRAVADRGELSPYSSTSLEWDDKWPIKPEILLDGGNMITDGKHVDLCDDVSLLTTGKDLLTKPFTTISATSSATAQAANIIARLMEKYPDLWVETIRGLIVHSAEWTEKMKEQFCKDDTKTKGRRWLLRCCGYGVADLQRAINSMDNNVNMIIQSEIQPYTDEGGTKRTKDLHLHEIPWLKDLLLSLGNTKVKMRVTLSYFIEPAPDNKGWNNKYRYASSALRFGVINKNQTKEDFLKSINKAAREDSKDSGDGDKGAGRWYLGSNNRDVGSIHSDIWEGSAVDLADCNIIAVYPVIGWWRERKNLGRINDKLRYSLIVSISTPDEEVDFYTPIETMIKQEIKVPV